MTDKNWPYPILTRLSLPTPGSLLPWTRYFAGAATVEWFPGAVVYGRAEDMTSFARLGVDAGVAG